MAHRCSFHQDRKIHLLLIWRQVPYVPYEKGVNKMHVGNIKQGQGPPFGWRPFFKCGKQKNKIALAVLWQLQLWGEAASGREWQLKSLLPVSCVHQNHCSLPNTNICTVGAPSFRKFQQGKRREQSSSCSPKEPWGLEGWRVGGVGSAESGRAFLRLQALTPPPPPSSSASSDEWRYCVHRESHPDWMQVSG